MKRIFTSLILSVGSLFLFSCGSQKTNESVFPNQASPACAQQSIKNKFVVGWEDGTYSLEQDTSEESFRKNFVSKNLDKIRHIDRDVRIQIRTLDTPSDVQAQTSDMQWQVDQVRAREVWNQGYYGQNIIVGVIDGMVDTTHPQLRNSITYSRQFNNQVNDANFNRHGSHVAGIIAADPSLGQVSGIAPRARIAAGQFISNDGGGSIGDAIMAMQAVAQQGARIINLSWGGAPCVDNLQSTMNQLSANGILLITAAGNESTNSDSYPTFPAAFMALNQINVAATGFNDLLASFSNRGYRTVHVAAPGQSIYSTTPGNTITAMDGTSMAAPVVSGAAALLMSAVPQANAQQVKQALMTTVDVPGQYLQTATGGRINVQNALSKLKQIVLK
jgi:subtilisin family serine protease